MSRFLSQQLIGVRDLPCYWTVVELGMPMVDLARKFDMTFAGLSYPIQRGKKIATLNKTWRWRLNHRKYPLSLVDRRSIA